MITGATRIAAVLGWPVDHSRSPQMMNAAFAEAGIDAVMIPVGVPPEKFSDAIAVLRAMNMLGASVTIPHKLAALAACDEVTDDAREIGAVNCLHVDGGRLVGHNTDAPGFVDALAAAGFAKPDARVVLLGAGGASRAVAYGLRDHTVDVIARKPDTVDWARALAWNETQLHDSFSRADLVVDCTSSALLSADEERNFVAGLPLDALPSSAWVSTLIYHRSTALLERAKARGHSIVDGRAMLVHQGARAFEIWTKQPAPVVAMSHALENALRGT